MKRMYKISILILVLLIITGIYYVKNQEEGWDNMPGKSMPKTNQNKNTETKKSEAKSSTDVKEGKKGLPEKAASNKSRGDTNEQVNKKSFTAEEKKNLPVIIDFASETCVPCQMQKPILEGISREYQGKLIVKILNIHEHSNEAEEYSIRVVPTQIFIDSSGKQVLRHEGLLYKKDIILILKEMGIE